MLRRLPIIPLLLLLSLALFAGCGEDDDTIASGWYPTGNTATDFFPLNEGAVWMLTSHTNGELDYVRIDSVAGQVEISGQQAVRVVSRCVDPEGAELSSDTIYYCQNLSTVLEYDPLTDGWNLLPVFSQYSTSTEGDTIWSETRFVQGVVEEDILMLNSREGSLLTAAGPFLHCYVVDESSTTTLPQAGIFSHGWGQRWYAPEVGFVYRQYRTASAGDTTVLAWELQSVRFP